MAIGFALGWVETGSAIKESTKELGASVIQPGYFGAAKATQDQRGNTGLAVRGGFLSSFYPDFLVNEGPPPKESACLLAPQHVRPGRQRKRRFLHCGKVNPGTRPTEFP